MSVKRGLQGVCAWLLASAVLASGASAATLVGDYQFQGTLNSSGPGATLTNIGPGANSFQGTTVMGQSRQVLAFPQHNGVRMAPAGIPNTDTPYSIVMTFKLDTVTGYRRIVDLSDDTEDRGVYLHDGHISFYLGSGSSDESEATVGAGQFFTFAATVDANGVMVGSGTELFLNGARVIASSIALAPPSNALRFFRDAATPLNNTEDSAGAVSCVRVFTGLLTDAEVAAIGAGASCGGPPPSSIARTTKCKKRKKRRHHALAAKKHKKKCKRKRKK